MSSIGSLSTSHLSSSSASPANTSGAPVKNDEATSIADHVAAADTQEPIRSASTTQGTLVDTYL